MSEHRFPKTAALMSLALCMALFVAVLALPQVAFAGEDTGDAEVTVVVNSPVPPSPIEYTVEFSFGTYRNTGDLTAVVDGPLAKFVRLTLGGTEVERKNYTLKEGSTLITLKEAYLQTRAPGTYEFMAEFSDGVAGPIELIIPAGHVPYTGDGAGPLLPLTALLAVSGLGMLTAYVLRRRALQ
ncbi:MAG: hypothetical protein LBL23_05580 [Coriobacteriales bacterium]|jgi:hypothetical protein|nr:hypothetical protein [Coriobacteriales bacterium]